MALYDVNPCWYVALNILCYRNTTAATAIRYGLVEKDGEMDHHWSHQVSETTLSFSHEWTPSDVCPLSVGGGSELGFFCLVGDQIKHDKLIYHSGPSSKLNPNDVILEVQGQKVAGYTSNDLREWILTAGQNSTPVLIKTAKAGKLPAVENKRLETRWLY